MGVTYVKPWGSCWGGWTGEYLVLIVQDSSAGDGAETEGRNKGLGDLNIPAEAIDNLGPFAEISTDHVGSMDHFLDVASRTEILSSESRHLSRWSLLFDFTVYTFRFSIIYGIQYVFLRL